MAQSLFKVGVCSDKNPRFRRTMEDAHIAEPSFGGDPKQGFFAVLDGHGGKQAAEYCEKSLAENFRQALSNIQSVPDAIDKSFGMTDDGLKNASILYPGCTCVVAYIRLSEDETITLYTGNVGDARAVLSRDGKAVRLSYDHKASDPNERQRITETGGFIMKERVNGTLAITRALGDIPMKEFVISHPYTTETRLNTTDTRLILACDGIWDVLSDQEAVDVIQSFDDPQVAAEQLLKESLKRGSTDNLTAMIIDLVFPSSMSSVKNTDTTLTNETVEESSNIESQ